VREKAAQGRVLVLHLIRNAIGQTYVVVAGCEPARKERINQNQCQPTVGCRLDGSSIDPLHALEVVVSFLCSS
jgi:hypothetical protein